MPLPRYHRIYLVLREQIIDGRYPPTSTLPGELELARQFGVSRVTVRAALDRLADERLIVRHRGIGTFPRPPVATETERVSARGVLENIVDNSLKTSVRIISLERLAAPVDVAEALKLATGEMVQKAVRVRSYKDEPLSCLTTFVPVHLAKRLTRRNLQSKPMLVLLEESGVNIDCADQTLSSQLADHSIAPLLEVSIGAPLLAVRRTVYGHDGIPVQLLRGLYRPDRYEYQMHLSRVGDSARIWVTQDGPPKPRSLFKR
jgi:GntR family transcriptional regulator